MTVGTLSALLACSSGSDEPLGRTPSDEQAREVELAPLIDTEELFEPLADAQSVAGDRWRGFNLTGKYVLESENNGYQEWEFETITDLGFNYARLPLDYRTYTRLSDWLAFTEEGVHEIDAAVRWAQEYGVHISLNLHRAPGFSAHDEGGETGSAEWVGLPEDQRVDLWTNELAQEVFIAHWEFFAHRYQLVSNEYMSFNLVNEPIGVSEEDYLELMGRTIDAIRAISPERTIILDGHNVAEEVSPAYADLDVVVSKHSYEPKTITHYDVPWWPDSASFPTPKWPIKSFMPPYLFGHYQADNGLHGPLIVRGTFAAGTELTLGVARVSAITTLELQADGAVLLSKTFDPSGADEDWQEVIYVEQYEIYQSVYGRDVSAVLDSAATEVAFYVPEGDWISFDAIGITLPGEDTIWTEPTTYNWGVPQAVYELTDDQDVVPVVIPEGYESYYEYNDGLDDWRAIAEQGVRVTIGEFGVYNRTPHDVTLALLESKLQAFAEAGFDWCLWNMVGDFGIFDSNRADVEYEDYGDMKLDRAMLELLQRY